MRVTINRAELLSAAKCAAAIAPSSSPIKELACALLETDGAAGKLTVTSTNMETSLKKEIAAYQEKVDYLIKSGSRSPAVMDRWVLKIQGLEEKKKHYEQVLRRELDELDDEFTTLKFMAQELQVRAQNIRFQKVA